MVVLGVPAPPMAGQRRWVWECEWPGKKSAFEPFKPFFNLHFRCARTLRLGLPGGAARGCGPCTLLGMALPGHLRSHLHPPTAIWHLGVCGSFIFR